MVMREFLFMIDFPICACYNLGSIPGNIPGTPIYCTRFYNKSNSHLPHFTGIKFLIFLKESGPQSNQPDIPPGCSD
jgi:hypothetical protein